MVNVGIVGFGFMGRMHYRCWRAMEGVEIAAICDSNPNLVEDSKKAVGNISGAAEEFDFSSIHIFQDFDRMLAEGNLDAVSITLPTHLHLDFTKRALAAGVHVLCEKPMALSPHQCREMIAAADESGKTLQIGHCLRFWPEWAWAKEALAGGRYGALRAATFQRLTCMPTWSIEGWLSRADCSGGMAMDLHIHDTDYIQHLLGTPAAVRMFGTKAAGTQSLVHVVTNYIYDGDMAVTAEASWAMSPSFGFEMSFNLVLEHAVITYDCNRDPAIRVCPAKGEAFTPDLPEGGDGYMRQIAHFLKKVKGEKVQEVVPPAESMESVRIVCAEMESVRENRTVSLR